jgi:hypothetical protein
VSSHHFVKEGQEPALLILDAISLELAEPLLEWAPLVMVSDTVLPTVLRWGTKIDVALVRVDRMEDIKTELVDQFPVEIITYHNQNDLLSIAFNFLINRKQKAVNVMTEVSDSLFDLVNPFTQKIQVDVFDQNINWLCIPNSQYQKWLPAKSRLKIRNDTKQNLQFTGLIRHPEYWEAEKDGMVTLQSDQVFWVGELPE